jgi:hypothetical protein
MPTMAVKKPKEIAAADLQKLQGQHTEYCHEDQAEDEHSKFMAEHGHPQAAKYRKLRRFFDTLQYASNHGERYIAFQDQWDFCTYHRPRLEVCTRSIPYASTVAPKWFKFDNMRGICPSDGERYLEFLRVSAEAGWPPELKPELRPGGFELTTSSKKLVGQIVAIIGKIEVRQSEDHKAYYFGWGGFAWPTFTGTQKILKTLIAHYRPYLLNERTAEDEEVDAATLPLHLKKFTLDFGEHVVIDTHHVRVPKIPLGGNGGRVLSNAMWELEDLCGQGYPWQGAVREWFVGWGPRDFHGKKTKGVIPAKEIQRLDRKFKGQKAP